jgi:hypothetical protein
MVPPGHYPAVHIPDRASHPRRLIGQQETDHFGDFPRLADSSDGVEAVETLQSGVDLLLFDEALVDRGLDHRGRDGVHPDASAGQFHCEMLGERVKAGLRQGVGGGGSRGDCLLGPHRSNVHDAPTRLPRDHVPRNRLRDKEQRPIDDL